MNLNLDINSYTIIELLDVIGIKEENSKITGQTIRNAVNNILSDISSSPNRENMEKFINSSYIKICDHFKIRYNSNDLIIHQQNETSGHELVKHESNPSYNTHSLELKKGKINPLLRQTYLQEMNINTLFRPNYRVNSSSNYQFTLPNPVKNVVSMKLSSFENVETVYSINDSNKNNEFTISIYDYSSPGVKTTNLDIKTIIIPNGTYTGQELVSVINTVISNNNITVEYESITRKITFVSDSFNNSFDLDFGLSSNNNRPYQLNLGWQMGFRERKYIYVGISDSVPANPTSFTGEGVYNQNYSKYLLLHVNDYNNNHSIVVNTPFQQGVIGSGEIIGKIPIINTSRDLVTHKRHYFGPVNIERLHIQLYDEYGNIVNTNNGDYSFSLELECLYDL